MNPEDGGEKRARPAHEPLGTGHHQDAASVSPSPRRRSLRSRWGERAGVRCSFHHLRAPGEGGRHTNFGGAVIGGALRFG